MLEVRVLGRLAADLDDRPVQLPADARARELLGWLVVAPGLHARSALAGRLRPDVGHESARKTLRDAVYELRRALGLDGRDAIVATRDEIGLEPTLVRTDLWEFRRHVAAGELEAAVEERMGELLAEQRETRASGTGDTGLTTPAFMTHRACASPTWPSSPWASRASVVGASRRRLLLWDGDALALVTAGTAGPGMHGWRVDFCFAHSTHW